MYAVSGLDAKIIDRSAYWFFTSGFGRKIWYGSVGGEGPLDKDKPLPPIAGPWKQNPCFPVCAWDFMQAGLLLQMHKKS